MLAHIVNRLFLSVVFATSVMSAEPFDPFDSPVTGFSDALVPLLTSFEKAKIQTTLRGFFARADSFSAFKQSEMEPSEAGLYLDVAVRDSDEVNEFSDRTEQKGGLTHRSVRIPPPKQGEQALVIQLRYGRRVSQQTIRAIEACITRIVTFSKSPIKP